MSRVATAIAAILLFASTARAAGPDGDWFILGGKGGCWCSNVDHPAALKLLERALKGYPLNCIAFTANDDWVALVGGTELYFNRELPATRKLAEWWKNAEARNFRVIAFAPQGGWVAIGDDNTYSADKIPADALAKLKELRNNKVRIRAVAFPPAGGWVILDGDGGVWHRDLPKSAALKLDELAAAKSQLLCAAFDARGNWVVLGDDNGVWSNDNELSVVKQLLELKSQKVPLRWVAFTAGEYTGDYALLREPTDRVHAVLDLKVARSGGRVEQWTVYSPVAPNHGGQDHMKTTLDPNGKAVDEHSYLKRPVLMSRVTDSPRSLHATLTVEGDLYARRLCPRPAGSPVVADLPESEAKLYTRASEHLNFEGKAFQEWLDRNGMRKQSNERDIAFARRVYSFIRDRFTYVFPPGVEHASLVCDRRRSDCGGLSMALVAILRANGIPSRLLQGRWAFSQDAPIRFSFVVPGQLHVKAEFFAKGTGWVPVDMAAAVCDRDAGEYAHFGNDPGDFITLLIDPDYEVDTHVTGRVRGLSLQGIVFFWKGDGVARLGQQEKWTVTKEPVGNSRE